MTTRIVIPYANADTDPVALHAVRRAVPVPRTMRRVEGDHGYADLFRELWIDGRPFILVEHDVVPAPGMIESLDGCGQSWCAHGYDSAKLDPVHGCPLGLAKFRPAGPVPFDTANPPTWEDLGDVVARELVRRGWAVHQHDLPVRHLARWDRLQDADDEFPEVPVIPPHAGHQRGQHLDPALVRARMAPGGHDAVPDHPPAVDTTPKKRRGR